MAHSETGRDAQSARYRKTSQQRRPRRHVLDEPVVAAQFHATRRGDVIRLTLSTFEKINTIDVRKFFTSKDSGLPCPTRKGLTLNLLRLPDLIEALQTAQMRAAELGLLDTDLPE